MIIGFINNEKNEKLKNKKRKKPKIFKEKDSSYRDISKLKLTSSINNHCSSVLAICILKDRRLASCSLDYLIKIYDLNKFQCELTIFGHTDSIVSISPLDKGYLGSSSWDKTIKIWEINRHHYQCIKTLRGHEYCVTKVIQLSKNRIASCSYDKSIKIWSSNQPYECIKTITGKTGCLELLLEVSNKKFFVTGANNFIHFWDNNTYECVKIIKNVGNCSNHSMIEIPNEKLVVGGWKILSIINILTLQLEAKINFDDNIGYIFSILDLKDGSILFGCENGEIYQAETKEYKLIDYRENTHEGKIYGLLLVNNMIISCAEDEYIKIFK